MKKCIFTGWLIVCVLSWSFPVLAEGNRTIIDGKGRSVTVPGKVTRVAANGAVNQIVLLLGGGYKLVATSLIVKKNPMFAKIYPPIQTLPAPFGTDLKSLNMETLVSARPQVVFGSFRQLDGAGITSVEMDLSGPEEIKKSILLVGRVMGDREEARSREFVTYYDSVVKRVTSRTAGLQDKQRPRVYLASGSDGLRTEGRNSIVNFWIEAAGGVNIASSHVTNASSMVMEEIVAANPDIIIATSPSLKETIVTSPQWASLKAVKNARVYVNPKGAYLWSVRSAEGALQYFWAAKLMHPELFADLDVAGELTLFYKKFYNYTLSSGEIAEILEPRDVTHVTGKDIVRKGLLLLSLAVCIAAVLFVGRRRLKKSKTSILFLLSLCTAMSAWAEEKEHELAPVVVSDKKAVAGAGGEAAPEEPPHSRFALPESARATQQVFTRKEIEAMRPRDVFDLIESSLGMIITRQGARVHNFTKVRGDEVSIILDGVYITTTEAQRALGDLPVSMIESVKLIRDSTVLTLGPLTKYGSAGAGSPNQGFIVITTRRGNSTETELKSSYASYNTVTADIFHGHSLLDDSLKLGLGYSKSRSSGKSDWNNGYDSDSFYANTGYSSKYLDSRLSLFLNQASRDVQRHMGNYTGKTKYPKSGPTPAGVLNQNIWRYDPINSVALSWNTALKWNENQTTSLTYGYSEVRGTQHADTISTKAAGKEFKDRTHEFNLSHTITSEKNTFKIGAQSILWYQLTEGKTTPREEESYGGYIYDEYRPTSRLSFDGAFRFDAKRIAKGGDKYRDDGGLVALTDNQWTDEAYGVALGSSYKLTPNLTLLARFSYNITPTPDSITTKNNAKLNAEERFKYEAGVDARIHQALNVTVTGFYYDISNAKVSAGTITVNATDSVTVYKSSNLRRYGVEAGVNGRLLESPVFGSLDYALGYTWFRDSSFDSDTNSPKHKVSASLNYRNGDYDANLTILRVDPYSSYGVIVGDFTTVNLNLGKTFRYKNMLTKVSFFGQNLTDEHFATNNKGFPANASWGSLLDVGATYGAEISVKF